MLSSVVKKSTVAGLTVFGVAVTAGVAYAFITAFVVTPDLDTGSVSGSGSNSCQAGSAVTFTVPDPTWNNTLGDYAVSTIDYSGINSTCTNLGTADLVLNLTIPPSGSSIANATASNMTQASGTLNLSTDITYADAANADYNFFVRNN